MKKYLKKPLVIFLAIFIIILLLVINLKSSHPTLTINATPIGVKISINDTYIDYTQFSQPLPPGTYTVTISYKDYVTETREVDLTSDQTINISLKPIIIKEAAVLTSLSPYQVITSSPVDQNTLIAIDHNSSFLIRTTPDETQTLYDKPISSFSLSYPLVSLIEIDKPDTIVTLNLETNQFKSTSLKNISPLVSTSLSPELLHIYILANLNPQARTTTLFRSPLDQIVPEPLFTTNATNIESISTRFILLFAYADALDASTVSIYDIQQNRLLTKVIGNNYAVSPQKDTVAVIKSQSLDIISLPDGTRKKYSFTTPANTNIAWKDNSTLALVSNHSFGVEVSYLDINTLKTTPPLTLNNLKNSSVRFITSSIDGILFVVDVEGMLWQIPLP